MSLSLKNHSHLDDPRESPPGPSLNNNRPTRSYAQVVSKQRESLMYHNTHHTLDGEGEIIVNSRIWRTSSTEDGIFFDMSKLSQHDDVYYLTILADQVPRTLIHTACVKKEGGRPYVEAYPTKEARNDGRLDALMQNGIQHFDMETNKHFKILPCKSIPDAGNIIKLALNHIPLYEIDEVLRGLQISLAPYGTLLDVGILRESKTQYFLGTGYAFISTKSTISGAPPVPLTHKIHWCETDRAFHAVWFDMPTWCRYCHAEGHTKFECSESKAKVLCYSCNQRGHRSFECPKKKTDVPQKKRKTTLLLAEPAAPPAPPITQQPINTSNNRYEVLATPELVDNEEQVEDWSDQHIDNDTTLESNVEVELNQPTEAIEADDNNSMITEPDDTEINRYIIEEERKQSKISQQQHGTGMTTTAIHPELLVSPHITPRRSLSVETNLSITTDHHPTATRDGVRRSTRIRKSNPNLVKTTSKKQQRSFIRYLRLQTPTIYAFQETHATHNTIDTLNTLFQGQQTLWTQHCGLVSYSSDYILTHIESTLSDRTLLCRVNHPQDFYQPFYILNIYAPTSSPATRRTFFDSITDLLSSSPHNIDLDRLIIVGDFNYSLIRPRLNTHTSSRWLAYLDEYFYNCMTLHDRQEMPTFERLNTTPSTIDYIYISNNLGTSITDNDITTLKNDWSDHNMLSISLNLGKSRFGPGLWRANPIYVTNPKYQSLIEQSINNFFDSDLQVTPQEQWDQMKTLCQDVTKKFGKRYVPWRKATIQRLQRKRHRFLSGKPTMALRQQILATLDPTIHALQQELTDIEELRAGIRWREKGERSPKYLKTIHTTRSNQQYLATLTPIDDSTTSVTDQEGLRDITQNFYQQLYTADEVDPVMIDNYLANIGIDKYLTESDRQMLLTNIDIEDLQEQTRRVTQTSSPGEDGFGYPFWSLLFKHPKIQTLALQVYNAALQEGIFPDSWQQIRVRLLPKKGDLTTLKNWRPISLINCDAKLFTRLLNKRMAPMVARLLNPCQTGFVPGRFIAENALALKIIMEQAQLNNDQGIGLLLDQEKAYDRVHPLYLRKALITFGFPTTMIDSLINLFFKNQVQVNVNGFFTDAIDQQRGLRQGDPLSPILFNLALEPFLLAIIKDPIINGYTFTQKIGAANPNPPPLKCLAYADDVCVFLTQHSDFDRLLLHMDNYSQASNARFNDHKTEAFSISGSLDQNWQVKLEENNMRVYHHRHSPSFFRYLGFGICYTKTQQDGYLENLLRSIRHQIMTYSQRRLSIQGRITITNILILSKLWYCLRLTPAPQAFFDTIRSLTYRYVWQKKSPPIAFDTLCQPKVFGGLSLLDASCQQKILQLRWIRNILVPENRSALVTNMLLHHLSHAGPTNAHHLVSLLCPRLRTGPLVSPRHILPLIFKAYDGINLPLKYSLLTVDQCLQFPLSTFFVNLPAEHWINSTKHRHEQGSLFFIKDEILQCLRTKVATDPRKYPNLLRRLLANILNRNIRLQTWVLDLIVTRPPRNDTLELTTLIDFGSKPTDTLNAQLLRHVYIPTPPHHPYFDNKAIKRFWTLGLDPESRTVWYKVMVGKIPLSPFLRRIGRTDSSLCHLCRQDFEDLSHFLVDCPVKQLVWDKVLGFYYPDLLFSSPCLFSTLCKLLVPSSILDEAKYLIICGTTLRQLWLAHWASVMDGQPFSAKQIANQSIQRTTILLYSKHDMD